MDKRSSLAKHSKGAMIMKSVSIFLASGRRGSLMNRQSISKQGTGTSEPDKTARRRKMEDSSGKTNPKQMENFKRKTHFSKNELEALCRIYKKLLFNCQYTSRALAASNPSSIIAKPHAIEGLDRIVFRELLHSTFDIVTEETLMERIYSSWDRCHEGLPIKLEGFLTGLSTFLRGSPPEKAGFCFRIYDLNSDGFITKDEMFILLRNCLIKQPQDEDPDEGVRDLCEIILKKFDIDKDGKISYSDFSQTVANEPLLLEAFGQCLPTESAASSFLQTLQG